MHFFQVLPHITPFEFENQANTGDSIQLNCYVNRGDLPVSISWSLNNKPITLHSGISMIPIGGRTSLLTIASLEAQHAGEYICTATNKAGSSSHSATLYINGTLFQPILLIVCAICLIYYVDLPFSVSPLIAPFDFIENTLNADDMASISCTVHKGDLPLNITWYLNGKLISNVDGISVVQTNKRISQLSIESVQANHAGNYTCITSNSVATATHTTFLHVNGTKIIYHNCSL